LKQESTEYETDFTCTDSETVEEMERLKNEEIDLLKKIQAFEKNHKNQAIMFKGWKLYRKKIKIEEV